MAFERNAGADTGANQPLPHYEQVAAGGSHLPFGYSDVATGVMAATNFDPQGIAEKRARRFIDEHILHHKWQNNPLAHVAAAERLEDAGQLSQAQAEWLKAIQTADSLNKNGKSEKRLEGTRKDESRETDIGDSVRERTMQEQVQETILELPVTIRVEAANFYAFHGDSKHSMELLTQADQIAHQLPPSVQRHLQLYGFLRKH